jgi:GNAT superfamily N-acetyltransferase
LYSGRLPPFRSEQEQEAMSRFTIDEVSIPMTIDSPDAADFIATVEVRNVVEADGFGTDDLAYSAADLLPGWLDTVYEPKRLFAARVDGRIVARAMYETASNGGEDVVWLGVQVLPEFRRRGIGTALSELLETMAAEDHRSKIIVYTVSKEAPGERVEAPTGFGSVPRDGAEVQFLLSRGYTLEQVERGSRLALPVDDDDLRGLLDAAAAAAGDDYAVHFWLDRTPERWRDDLAVLLTRMSTDAPTAGLEEPEDPWTAERLLDEEKRRESSPRTALTAAALHIPSGRLVGFTELNVPIELDRPVEQGDTLVLKEHRGHRLGMLLKVANLRALQDELPGHPAIITFNAEENRHMLDVNEAVGFVPIGYEGAWKKLL